MIDLISFQSISSKRIEIFRVYEIWFDPLKF